MTFTLVGFLWLRIILWYLSHLTAGNRILTELLGTEYTDQVDLGSGLVIPKQSIGVASKVFGNFLKKFAPSQLMTLASPPDLMTAMVSLALVLLISPSVRQNIHLLKRKPPDSLPVGTLSPGTSTSIPTVTDNLSSSGAISANTIGISFQPTTSEEVLNGELTWGGTDSSRYTGTITYMFVSSHLPVLFFVL